MIIAYGLVLFLIVRTLDWDKEKFKAYRTILEKKINYSMDLKEFPDLKDPGDIKSGYRVWFWCQVLITGVILFGNGFFIYL